MEAIEENKYTFAVLIDGDNAQPSQLGEILSEVNKHGTIAIKRIYGDWTTPNMGGWKALLKEYAVRPFQQFRYGKNDTDSALIMDAMEILYMPSRPVDAFCIASSDSDYANLATRIRERGLFVLGIGNRNNTKSIFIKACNRFIFTENLQSTEEESERTLEDLLIEAYFKTPQNEDGWASLAVLGATIRKLDSSFDPRTYKNTSLLSIVKSYNSLFEIKSDNLMPPNHWIKTLETASQTGDVEVKKDEELEGALKKYWPPYGFIQHETGDYFFQKDDAKNHYELIDCPKGSKVRFSVFKKPNPKAVDTSQKNGRANNVYLVKL